jgi:PIN domain nuclease of toxin-antitoxin system
MRVLLDTHAVLWWLSDNPRLSDTAEAAISDPGNEVWVSACAGYEIRYKQSRGRLPPFAGDLQEALRRDRIGVLPISLAHALAAAALPGPHRDPWDRLMIAQAKLATLTVVSVDRVFEDYGVPTLW